MMFSKAKRCHIVLVLTLIATTLISTGCPGRAVPFGIPPPPWIFRRPAITSDGAGGTIVFYAIEQGGQRQFWGQRVDKEGNPLWGREGVLIGKVYTKQPLALDIVADEAGGAILVWRAISKVTTRQGTLGVYIARVSPQGETLWQRQVLRLTGLVAEEFGRMPFHVTSDGSRGVIMGWLDGELHVNIQRIDPDGQFLWGEGGLRVSKEPFGPENTIGGVAFDVVLDETGAVIFVWAARDGVIFAQKISPEGEVLWPERGVQVGPVGGTPEAHAVSDGSGGAIITWTQELFDNGSPQGWEVLAQRIDDQGNPLWEQPGIPLFKHRFPIPRPVLRTISTGAGEAIVTWWGLGGDIGKLSAHIFAQKIDIEGNLQWQEGGVLISGFCLTWLPAYQIVSDNAGGAILIVRYQDKELGRTRLEAQRIDAEGNLLWPERLSLTTAPGGPFSMAPDGEGGVFVAWVAYEFGPLRPYIQRISAEGEPMWGDKGIPLNP